MGWICVDCGEQEPPEPFTTSCKVCGSSRFKQEAK